MAIQAGVALLLLGALLFWYRAVLADIYWGPLATDLGMIVNGVIVALFVMTFLRIFYLLYDYIREDKAIDRFREQMDFGLTEAGVQHLSRSLVVQRYRALQQGQLELEHVQQPMLAAILMNQEMTRLGLVRLVQNVLILLGVFGTVASLSLALVGASDLLTLPRGGGGIILVVRGMATALSTTMTAIAAYLVLTFVSSRLVASQVNVCQRIESLTLRHLMPLLARSSGNLSYNLTLMLKDLRQVAGSLVQVQKFLAPHLEALESESRERRERNKFILEELRGINQALVQGFRLNKMDKTES